MRILSDSNVEAVLRAHGFEAAGTDLATWNRLCAIVRSAYRLGLDAEVVKCVVKQTGDKNGQS